jgi:exodeoxyribonuclease-5
MQWSPQQERALREVADFMENPDRQVFYLAGFAGTGKTTLAKHFADNVSGLVLYGAFTGKAAYVLRQKGCADATTIHALIYISRDKSKAKLRELEEALADLLHQLQVENGPDYDLDSDRSVRALRSHIHEEETALKRPMFVLNPDSPVRDAALLIIDECSMVDDIIGKDLLSFGVKILVLGDPGQLPPVFGTGFFTSQTPDFTLTEIHRQAKDNPILRMATDVREGRSLRLGTYGESRVITKEQLTLEDVLSCDQMLVGRNETRRDSNVRLRKLRMKDAYNTYPQCGDRIVCLRNDHEMGLLNGAIWNVVEAGEPTPESTIAMRIEPEDGKGGIIRVTSHTHYFEKRGEKLPWYEKKNAQEFDYGYALTVHKSQGSQWDDVLLFDESHAFREAQAKWLYTGITRAAKRITIVRM